MAGRSPQLAAILAAEGFVTPRNRQPLSASMVCKMPNEDPRAAKQLHNPDLDQDEWSCILIGVFFVLFPKVVDAIDRPTGPYAIRYELDRLDQPRDQQEEMCVDPAVGRRS